MTSAGRTLAALLACVLLCGCRFVEPSRGKLRNGITIQQIDGLLELAQRCEAQGKDAKDFDDVAQAEGLAQSLYPFSLLSLEGDWKKIQGNLHASKSFCIVRHNPPYHATRLMFGPACLMSSGMSAPIGIVTAAGETLLLPYKAWKSSRVRHRDLRLALEELARARAFGYSRTELWFDFDGPYSHLDALGYTLPTPSPAPPASPP